MYNDMNTLRGVTSVLHTLLEKTTNKRKWPNLDATIDATKTLIAKERMAVPKFLLNELDALRSGK